MATIDQITAFYDAHYDVLDSWTLRPGVTVVLGDKKAPRCCRFCGKGEPAVTFRKIAHAIPEGLGNKSIESIYECDVCNEKFGRGIENDLGNWSKPVRTFARIRGKGGVPTLKKGGNAPGWRIEYDRNVGFKVRSYDDEPIFDVDEANQRVTFRLRRDAYTPVAVLKAFIKIGLTLMPQSEIVNFRHALAWVGMLDHSVPFAESLPIIHQMQPGPVPMGQIVALILRRKEGVTGVPYCYLILAYGNEVIQLPIPSRTYDIASNGQPFPVFPFPIPLSFDPAKYGPSRVKILNLSGREVVKGEITTVVIGYEEGRRTPASLPPNSRGVHHETPALRSSYRSLACAVLVFGIVALAFGLSGRFFKKRQ